MNKSGLNIKRIEYNIYNHIMQDFAEYFNNRMNVYQGVVDYLSTIYKKDFNNMTTDEVYKAYEKHCKECDLVCLKAKQFARVLTMMCGYEIIRKKTNGVQSTYYQEVS